MNPVLDRMYRTHQVEDTDGRRVDCSTSIVNGETGRCLYEWIRQERPARTLEIGLGYGASALFICQAHQDNENGGYHTAIDPNESTRWQSIGRLNVQRAGLDNRFRCVEATSFEALPRLLREGKRFDFAFIDGSHKFDYALVDFFYIDKLLPVGGCVAVDDLWMPGVRKVVSFVLNNRAYQLVDPASTRRTPLWKWAMRTGRRCLQNPLGRDWSLKVIPENICFLRKTAADQRSWDFHRAF